MVKRLSRYIHSPKSPKNYLPDEQTSSQDGAARAKTPTSLSGQEYGRKIAQPVAETMLLRIPDEVLQIVLQYLLADCTAKSTFLPVLLVCKQWARVGRTITKASIKTLQLPDEILLDIFAYTRAIHLQRSSTSHLYACIRTCRQWYRVGMPLLYEHFVLDVNYQTVVQPQIPHRLSYQFIPSARFYSKKTQVWAQPWTITGIGVWIHSLSVEVHFEQAAVPGNQTQSIMEILDVLPNIRTFSIRAAPLQQDNNLDRNRLTKLIEHIPPRIRNFELDTQGRDISITGMSRQENTFCQVLGRLLPQLHSLRLRLSTLCPHFPYKCYYGVPLSSEHLKVEPMPDPKSLSIFIASRDFHTQSLCCISTYWNTTYPPSVKLVDELQWSISTKNIFPNLVACSIICMRHDMSTPNTIGQRLICRAFDAETGAWQKRAYIPSVNRIHAPKYFGTDWLGDENETLVVGKSFSQIQALPGWRTQGPEMDVEFEGEARWYTDALGARHPDLK